MIALALSGGGSRAIAFHLGCMRALSDRNVIEKISVISSVSGGSVIAAMYAYSDTSFEEFDFRVVALLRRGLHKAIIRKLFVPDLFLRAAATNLIARPVATLAKIFKREPPLKRWASRTDALERALQDVFGDLLVGEIARPHLDIVLNASEMRTGTAFRFGNHISGTWRFGEIVGNRITVAHAVACSAAYPMFLPAFDRNYNFVKGGEVKSQRVIVTDGGVYDNLGISCLEPGRNKDFSLHVYPADYIICCSAGHGQFSGDKIPFSFSSRASSSFECVFRKAQDSALQRLHMHERAGNLKGFILPYLGQQDQALPVLPLGLIRREQVYGYPTDFAAMSDGDIRLISLRGEQLTRSLLTHYCPEL